MNSSTEITVWNHDKGSQTTITLQEAADCCELHPDLVEEFARGHFVRAYSDASGDMIFDAKGLLRLRHLAVLHNEGRASLRLLRHIAHLMDELEIKDQELRKLREQTLHS
ncbi:MAG: hypothetical protein ACSHYB_01655 [Roseibacillus sp.]